MSRLADEIAQVLRHSVDHLSPRRFEELVTEMYRRAGFEVELTPASGDGGVDVYAVRRHDLGSTPTVVQAKRYKPGLKVEASVVRELYGTVNLQDASAGVLITTSTFQPGAEALAAQHRYRLSLRNYASLQQMLRATASQRPEPCYRPSRRFSETQVQTERDIH